MLLRVVVLVLSLLVVGVYTGVVRLRARADEAWSDVEAQLKRRHDLVPSLVETVTDLAPNERGTLDAVVAARARAVAAAGPVVRAEAEGALTQALRQALALAETHPQLRALGSFVQLRTSLDQIEDAIQTARRRYNAVVRDLNTRIGQFPSNLVAHALGVRSREFFELTSPDDAASSVDSAHGMSRTAVGPVVSPRGAAGGSGFGGGSSGVGF